jgi:hypothetical protein
VTVLAAPDEDTGQAQLVRRAAGGWTAATDPRADGAALSG